MLIWVVDHVFNKIQSWKLGPFDKKCTFEHIWLLAIFQKWPTLTMHISSNFNPREVFLDFLESLGCPISNLFVLSQLDLPCSCKKLWPKRCFCWLFKRTYLFMSAKWALDGKFLIKYEEVMLGQNFGWLFLRNPNLATFEFWWIRSITWGIMIKPWSNDGYYFKMLMLNKNLEVWLYVGHNWLLP